MKREENRDACRGETISDVIMTFPRRRASRLENDASERPSVPRRTSVYFRPLRPNLRVSRSARPPFARVSLFSRRRKSSSKPRLERRYSRANVIVAVRFETRVFPRERDARDGLFHPLDRVSGFPVQSNLLGASPAMTSSRLSNTAVQRGPPALGVGQRLRQRTHPP